MDNDVKNARLNGKSNVINFILLLKWKQSVIKCRFGDLRYAMHDARLNPFMIIIFLESFNLCICLELSIFLFFFDILY